MVDAQKESEPKSRTVRRMKNMKNVNRSEPYEVGKDYLIRTVTMIYTGKLESVYEHELVISSAAWIPETERWMQAVAESKFREVEPYPANKKVIIGRGAILDAVTIPGLPIKQK